MGTLKGKAGLMTASLMMMSFLAPTSILARIAEAFPETPLQIVQLLTVIPNVISVISSILAGKLTSRFYKRHLILISGLFCPAAGLFIFFFHPSVYIMVFFTALMGISCGIRITCVPALICDCYNEKESSRLIGMQAGFISAGAMLFIWIGGQLSKEHWEYCYLSYLLVLLLLIIEFFCLPKGRLDRKKENNKVKDPIPKSILFYTFIAFFFGIFIFTFNSNISMVIDIRQLGGTVEASYVSMLYNLAGAAAGCITGFVILKFREHTFTWGLLLGILGMTLCFLGIQFVPLCIGGILCGAAFSVVIPVGNYFASVNSSDYNRAFCIAFFNAGSAMGQFASPLFFGSVLGMLSIEQRFLGSAAGLTILILVTIAGIGYIHKKQKV